LHFSKEFQQKYRLFFSNSPGDSKASWYLHHSRPFDLALRQLGLIGPATRWHRTLPPRCKLKYLFVDICYTCYPHSPHTNIYICTYKTNRHNCIFIYVHWYIYIWTIVLISRFFTEYNTSGAQWRCFVGKSSNWGIVHRHDYQRVATIESFMKSWNCLFFIKLIKTYRFLIRFILIWKKNAHEHHLWFMIMSLSKLREPRTQTQPL
jgi:hypothetical protein